MTTAPTTTVTARAMSAATITSRLGKRSAAVAISGPSTAIVTYLATPKNPSAAAPCSWNTHTETATE